MRPRCWLLTNLLFFVIIETVGYIFWGDTPTAATAFFYLLFSFLFFGIFFSFYAMNVYVSKQNSWLREVRGMKPFRANYRMYMAWLFVHDEERWVVYTTIMDILFTVIFGAMLFLLFTDGHISIQNSSIGFCAACLFLGLLVWSFWEGYWKPRFEAE